MSAFVNITPYILFSIHTFYYNNFSFQFQGCSSDKVQVTADSNEYPPNLNCEWLLKASDNNTIIQLTIDGLELEYCEHCKCDYLEVYDGEESTAVKLGRYCKGNVHLFSTRQKMFIVFHTDSKTGGKGFTASHKNVRKNEGKLFFFGGG